MNGKVNYELPRAAVAEAIVNAVAHRDYTSNGSVQVMLFKDRLEIWNPGLLPLGLSTAKLRLPHASIPANPLLAEPMYLAGYIERLGTGTGDIIRLCKEAGLREPEFIQEENFKTIIWRTLPTTQESDARQATGEANRQASEELSSETTGQASGEATGQATGQASGEASGEVTRQAGGEVTGEVIEEVRRVVLVLKGEMKRAEIQKLLDLKHDDYFRLNYINPALETGYIEMKYPESLNHPDQRYRLTEKGEAFHRILKAKRKK